MQYEIAIRSYPYFVKLTNIFEFLAKMLNVALGPIRFDNHLYPLYVKILGGNAQAT